MSQALDLGVFVDPLSTAIDQDAPARLGSLVIVVRLERHQILAFGRGQLRPASGAKDRVLAVHNVVYRQDHYLAIGEEADPSDRDRAQQFQAPVERQYLEPCVICGVPCHFTLPEVGRRLLVTAGGIRMRSGPASDVGPLQRHWQRAEVPGIRVLRLRLSEGHFMQAGVPTELRQSRCLSRGRSVRAGSCAIAADLGAPHRGLAPCPRLIRARPGPRRRSAGSGRPPPARRPVPAVSGPRRTRRSTAASGRSPA